MDHLRQVTHGGHKPRLGGIGYTAARRARGPLPRGAVGVADGQAALGPGVVLQGGFAVPAGRSLGVLGHALAELITPA